MRESNFKTKKKKRKENFVCGTTMYLEFFHLLVTFFSSMFFKHKYDVIYL